MFFFRPWNFKNSCFHGLVLSSRQFAISIRYRHRVGNDLRSGKRKTSKHVNFFERFLEMADLLFMQFSPTKFLK